LVTERVRLPPAKIKELLVRRVPEKRLTVLLVAKRIPLVMEA